MATSDLVTAGLAFLGGLASGGSIVSVLVKRSLDRRDRLREQYVVIAGWVDNMPVATRLPPPPEEARAIIQVDGDKALLAIVDALARLRAMPTETQATEAWAAEHAGLRRQFADRVARVSRQLPLPFRHLGNSSG